ncbi:hypothetical protein, partial [Streptomyces sp. NPDC052811]|uniref:hypothetical protein n=1 Tax=Streptomyces sp. NPDC052811 TaxID=3155731 RepID=UPI003431E81A
MNRLPQSAPAECSAVSHGGWSTYPRSLRLVDPRLLDRLEVLTKALDVSVCDEAGGEAEECFVDVITSFP